MDYSMKQKTNIIAAVCLIASAIYAGNQTFDQYRAWPEGNQIGPVYEQDFSTGDLKVFTAFPGYTIGKYGYNGSPVSAPNANPARSTDSSRSRFRT